MIYNGDPEFVNTSVGNYRLGQNSDAWNTGNNDSINITGINFDLDLNVRINFGTVDMGCYESDQVLPVELLEFKAHLDNGNVRVSWTTATEINNDYFTVERSHDGIHFVEIKVLTWSGYFTSSS